jgi:hypothetical protein
MQLGNLNVLSGEERDRLMTLRERFHLPGRVSACDATPMPSSLSTLSESADPADAVDEQRIRSIAERVLAELKRP